MDLTIILARFWGIVLVTACGAYVVNRKLLQDELKAVDKQEVLLISGFIALLVGAVHVAIYNNWEFTIRGIITLLGWITLLKGVLRLVAPQYVRQMIKRVRGKAAYLQAGLLVFLFLGSLLLYVGFWG